MLKPDIFLYTECPAIKAKSPRAGRRRFYDDGCAMTDQQAKTPEILAHRGYAARFPENTREALRAAVQGGARLLEFDIQLSRDGIPHLLHDEDFARTGNSPSRIFDLSASEIAKLSVNEPARFDNAFEGIRAPRLEQVAQDLSGWPEVTAFVELKRHSLEHFGVPDVVEAVLADLRPVLNQCVFISFELPAIETVRQRVDRPVGWALRSWDDSSKQHAEEVAPEYLFCNVKRLPREPEPLWAGPWAWVVYEITDAAEALELRDRGVGVIETMAFVELHQALGGVA
ncbi:MAG: glycerophosphodiester phosphodiesterase family protein [Gammaproteobacteria bacterium]